MQLARHDIQLVREYVEPLDHLGAEPPEHHHQQAEQRGDKGCGQREQSQFVIHGYVALSAGIHLPLRLTKHVEAAYCVSCSVMTPNCAQSAAIAALDAVLEMAAYISRDRISSMISLSRRLQ